VLQKYWSRLCEGRIRGAHGRLSSEPSETWEREEGRRVARRLISGKAADLKKITREIRDTNPFARKRLISPFRGHGPDASYFYIILVP